MSQQLTRDSSRVGNDQNGALVLSSADGVTWTREELPVFEALGGGFFDDVAFGNGIVVAVGFDGNGTDLTARRSAEGVWDLQSGKAAAADSVIFGNGTFLISTAAGLLLASRDGLSWDPSVSAFSVVFDGDKFVALGTASASLSIDSGQFTTSADGFTWSSPSPTPHELARWNELTPVGLQILGFADSTDPSLREVQLVGVPGQALADYEMTTTTIVATGAAGIASDGTHVVVGSTDTLWTTSLPITSAPWTAFDAAGRGFVVENVAYSRGQFIAVGFRSSPPNKAPAVITSADGLNWLG